MLCYVMLCSAVRLGVDREAPSAKTGPYNIVGHLRENYFLRKILRRGGFDRERRGDLTYGHMVGEASEMLLEQLYV